jgi:OmpR-family two-component system manganese-sensing response regulator
MKHLKGRILCVDDDQDTREMLRALLGLEGYEVIEAQNVAEGLNEGAGNNFDLILLDWVFEDGTGVELCEKLRSIGATTPVLFCSGRSDKVDIETAMKAGAQGFLVKPVEVTQLFDSLSQFLNAGGGV